MLIIARSFIFFAVFVTGSALAQHSGHSGVEAEPEGVSAGGPITPADWKHYNANKDFQPTELPNGSVMNMTSLARFAPIARMDGDDAPVIAHPDHNRIAEASGGFANPNIAELGPHLDARGEMQFAANLPATGPDAPPFPLLDAHKQSAWMPATQTVNDGETLTIAGSQMQFFHAITDTEDSLTIWIPEWKMVIDNAVWPVTNTYTLRGDRYRDPKNWIAALRKIRDLQPEIILSVGSGAMPLTGKETGQETVLTLIDLMTFIYDQSLRLTSQGVNMSDIRHQTSDIRSRYRALF